MCIGVVLRLLSCCGSGVCLFGNHSSKLMRKDIKIGYGLLQLVYSVIIFLMIYFLIGTIDFLGTFIGCPSGDDLRICLGISSAFRLSACLAVFHLVIGLSCLTRDGFAKCMNEGAWGFKLVMVALMWIGTLFIKNEYFIHYSEFALYASGIYLFVQMVSVVDAMYLWAEYWAQKYDDGNTCYGVLMIFAALGLYGGLGYLIYFSFTMFWVSGCWGNYIILVAVPFFAIAFIVLTILKFHPKGSILTAGAISFYGMFMAWTALISNPYKQCNRVINGDMSMIAQVISSFAVGFLCTIYWSLSYKPSGAFKDAGIDKTQVNNDIDEEEEEKILEAEEKDRDLKKEGGETGVKGNLIDNRDEPNAYWAYQDNSYIKFHFVMLLFSIYLSPVFSNWGNATINGSNYTYGDNLHAPFYIKIAICFGGLLLYTWTIVAPKILTEREFDN